jgi:hypothetical protein
VSRQQREEIIDMTKQWNFIIENKLITVYEKCPEKAEEAARKIYLELQQKAV